MNLNAADIFILALVAAAVALAVHTLRKNGGSCGCGGGCSGNCAACHGCSHPRHGNGKNGGVR